MPLMTEVDWLALASSWRVRIKAGWADAGREGDALAIVTGRNGQVWIAVQWDGEDDPDLHKLAGLADAGCECLSCERKEKSK